MAKKLQFTGATIKEIRKATPNELEDFGMDREGGGYVIELENGNLIFASQDEEGNGPGTFFGLNTKTKKQYYLGFGGGAL